MNTRHRQVQRGFLLRRQIQVGKEVGIGINAVAKLSRTIDGDGFDFNTFASQQFFVPLEGLSAGLGTVGVSGNLSGDLVERDGVLGIKQGQDQIGESFEFVIISSHTGDTTP